MKVPLKWLASYVDLAQTPEQLAQLLTMSGNEVGAIERTGGPWPGVVVGRVTAVEPHPNADRLRLATLDTGDGMPRTVVCGAPNIEAGQRVAFAATGAELIDAHSGKLTRLKAATIRGVESAGMVCSERELGLSQEHEGILVLPDDAPVGAPLDDYLGDTVLDLDLTPNRPDCMSIVGIAREVAALTGREVHDIEPLVTYEAKAKAIAGRVTVQIRDSALCPRYLATLVEGVRVGPSPAWMQERLRAVGVRPINNVVDVTNYVMIELGQPLHAFDFDRLKEGRIVVRRAQAGERLTLLDGSEQDLTADMLAICDAARPVALAGIMGGAATEVTERTTRVLIEAATFDSGSIRRTASALRLRTEASARFEKGLPPGLAEVAVRRATKLLIDTARGRAADGVLDVYPGKQRDLRVTVPDERIRRVLGVDVPRGQVRAVLTSLGFSCRWVPPDRYVVRVPYWRTDVRIAEDVIEEVARIIGYDQFPMTPLSGPMPEAIPQPVRDVRERLRDALAASGLQEIITYTAISDELQRKVLPPEDTILAPPLRIANPLSAEYEYVRTSLRPGVLRALADNASGRAGLTAMFEVGRAYREREDDLPSEVEYVCGAVTGRLADRWGLPAAALADFFVAKGYVEAAFGRLGLPLRFAETDEATLLPGRTAHIQGGMEEIGVIGQLDPRVAARFGFRDDVFLFELDVAAVALAIERHGRGYHAISRFPAVVEDLALLVDATLSAGALRETLEETALVESARVFDVYGGEGIAAGKKSIAFSVTYRAADRTLSDEDVGRARAKLLERLRREHGAELRGG